MLGTGIRATYAVRDGVSRTALRSERFFVFSRETRKAGNVRGPAVANPSHCERQSPVRTKPWPSRRSFLDLRRNGHRVIYQADNKAASTEKARPGASADG